MKDTAYMFYFKILETFLLKIMFSKGEYNFNSPNFNPLKLMIFAILLLNVYFSFHLVSELRRIRDTVNLICPNVLIMLERDNDPVPMRVPKHK